MDTPQLDQPSQGTNNCSRKRIIHFSDGTVEESLDEQAQPLEDNSAASEGSTILRWIDWLGSKIAWSLGISSPKYYYIIERSKQNSKYDSLMLGDLDDPHVSILQNHILTNDAAV